MTLQVIVIETETLGDRSYLIHDGKSALVIDPQRDIDRVELLLRRESVDLSAVAETHIHNDYLSGGMVLAQRHGAQYILNAEDEVNFEFFGMQNLQVVNVGAFAIKAFYTPGHTFTHISYALINAEEKFVGLFSGGSLLHGSTGRPDLLGLESAEELAGLQHGSAHLLARAIPGDVELYPTHGFGSFCSATPSTNESSTISDEKESNPVFLQPRRQFVTSTLKQLDKYPTYFNYMRSANSWGAPLCDLSPITKVTESQISVAIQDGAWVVDLRTREDWCSGHIKGSISLGLDGSFASYLGWLLPLKSQLFLISNKERDIFDAQRELVRIGIENIAGCMVDQLPESFDSDPIRVALFADYPLHVPSIKKELLDVRTSMEYATAHIAGSRNIPFYEVKARVKELPIDSQIWVHCASGYRAAAIIGFIENSGRNAVLINEDFSTDELAKIPGIEIISNEVS